LRSSNGFINVRDECIGVTIASHDMLWRWQRIE
jgi:hypothetical protein